ncbi:MAG: alpha/beta hydrolase [Myxococcota bacterium]|nr:alpha/beta hydrolase [Myxococcota bacterium]
MENNKYENGDGKNPLADPRVASAVFFPRPDMPYGPESPVAQDHFFDAADGVRLRLRLFLGEKRAPIILFFHGNGETARDYDLIAPDYLALPASFVVAEYRGYGPCTGSPSITTFLPDAHRSLDALKAILKKEGRLGPIVVMGRSLGSAPAIELAATRSRELAGLIIESGFANIVPLLTLIGVPAASLGITEDHGPNNYKKMASIALPTLIIHAENDTIIRFEEAELLHGASADAGKVLFRVPSAGHNDIQARAGNAYFHRIRELLSRVSTGERDAS